LVIASIGQMMPKLKGYGVWKEWEMESEPGKIRLLSI
jgi:hypothetical protein